MTKPGGTFFLKKFIDLVQETYNFIVAQTNVKSDFQSAMEEKHVVL